MIAICIACGCDDSNACIDPFDDPCSWLRVDWKTGRGVCSCCTDHVKRWDAGNREPQRRTNTLALRRLSARELQVFHGLARGDSIEVLAKRLQIDPSTVSTYRGRIVQKMGFESDVDMAHYAIRHRLIEPKYA